MTEAEKAMEKTDYGTGEPDRLDGAGEAVLDDDIPDMEDALDDSPRPDHTEDPGEVPHRD